MANQLAPATAFRQTATTMATKLLKDWVGDKRAAEATGRIAAALSASAASARDPSDFYECTPQSIAVCVATAALTGIMPSIGSCALAYVQPQRARAGEKPQLQYSLSHRGLNALARRSGQTMIAVPVGANDTIEATESGEVAIVSRDLDDPPTTFEDLRGVVLVIKELDSGVVTCTQWVPKKLIESRRAMSRSWSGNGRKYSPWTNWPVEMCMKTAMHYAISRGWCVIDDADSTSAIATDSISDRVEIQPAALLPGPESPAELPQHERVRAAAKRAASQNKPEDKPTDTVSEPETASTVTKSIFDTLSDYINTAASAEVLVKANTDVSEALAAGEITGEQSDSLAAAMERRFANLEG